MSVLRVYRSRPQHSRSPTHLIHSILSLISSLPVHPTNGEKCGLIDYQFWWVSYLDHLCCIAPEADGIYSIW